MMTLSGYNSTNVTAQATFTPGFAYGERHELFVHAKGRDNQWSPFQKIILNPNIDDILDKIQTNYSQVSTLSFMATASKIIEGEVLTSEEVSYQQAGPYRMRWDNQTSGESTIVNGNEIAFIDSNGRITPMFLVIDDDPSAAGSQETFLYWDVEKFRTQHDMLPAIVSTNSAHTYLFSATPKSGVFKPYTSIECDMDFRYGVVTEIAILRVRTSYSRLSILPCKS